MSSFSGIIAEARFAFALPRFFRRRVTLEDSRKIVARRLANRAGMFRTFVERSIFRNTASPYLWLFNRAGIGLKELDAMLALEGLEATLIRLRAAGVFVTFEEFKGRIPIVRDGATLNVTAHSFDNPDLGGHLRASTSGSTGAPTRLAIDLNNVIDRAPALMLVLEAHNLLGAPSALWRSILPSIAAISSILRGVAMSNVPDRWFSPLGPDELSAPLKNRFATSFILNIGRMAGARLPSPEHVPFDQAVVVARWAHEAVRTRGRALVRGHVSALARVAAAASDAGIDLTGTVLWGGGEPPTQSKVDTIERSGATFCTTYYLSEAGAIGLACARPADPTDVHVMKDAIAVVADEPWDESPRQMLWLTSLIGSAPKVMLNVETDDVATFEKRDCGCPLAAAGFDDHLRDIRSMRKLTSEGMTLLGIDVMALVEDFLPATFGGSGLHYQLEEEEDTDGASRVILVVDPSISLPDEETTRAAVVRFLQSRPSPAPLAATTWSQAGSLAVRRARPGWSEAGKLPALRSRRKEKDNHLET
jgi:hypothetical protein